MWFEKEEAHWSNERTMLSHFRTGFAAIVAGLAMIEFFSNNTRSLYAGTAFVVLGVFFLIIGTVYYLKRKKTIEQY